VNTRSERTTSQKLTNRALLAVNLALCAVPAASKHDLGSGDEKPPTHIVRKMRCMGDPPDFAPLPTVASCFLGYVIPLVASPRRLSRSQRRPAASWSGRLSNAKRTKTSVPASLLAHFQCIEKRRFSANVLPSHSLRRRNYQVTDHHTALGLGRGRLRDALFR
jgi:hypothetical protein